MKCSKHIGWICGFVVCFLVCTLYAQPVEVTLTDGTQWVGEMDQFVTVEIKKGSKTERFEGDLTRVTDSYIIVGGEFVFIADITSIRPETETADLDPGDVNDDKLEPVDAGDNKVDPEDATDDNIEEHPQTIALVPLKGRVGFLYGVHDPDPDSDWFDWRQLREMFKRAERAKVVEVILEIDSPGGLVIERDSICDVIEEYRGKFVITAYPHDAISAASTIALTCDKLIAAPNSIVGAGVVMSGGDAVDKKYASADASIVRTYLANAGRSGLISDAFSLVEAELWYNESKNIFASSKPEESGGWIEIDGPNTVLTFDSQPLVDLKIAAAKTDDIESLYTNYSIELYEKRIDDLKKNAARDAEKLEKVMVRFFSLKAQNELDFWLDELELALRRNPRDDDAWARIKKTEREVRKKVHRITMESEEILEKVKKERYDFMIHQRILAILGVVSETGRRILDIDEMFDNISLVRKYVDEMINAMKQLK